MSYLRMGLAVLLVLVALKLLLSDFVHIPPGHSLGIIVGIFAAAVAASRLSADPVTTKGNSHGGLLPPR